MRYNISTKEAALKWAKERAQRTGFDHFVVDKGDGTFAAGSENKIAWAFPHSTGWAVRYRV